MKRYRIHLLIILALAVAGIAFWLLSPVEHLASGHHQETFVVDCEFDKFRQIMVRKNAAKAIVANSGMELIDEQIQDLSLDTSGDDRPLLNAIRGKSKTELVAIKTITVKLNDPQLGGEELTLKQNVDVKPERMQVNSKSVKPAGRLQDYRTELTAGPSEDATEVTLTVDMSVMIRVPRMFVSRADSGVQKAAVDAISDQRVSMEQFIEEHADERLILPEFLSR